MLTHVKVLASLLPLSPSPVTSLDLAWLYLEHTYRILTAIGACVRTCIFDSRENGALPGCPSSLHPCTRFLLFPRRSLQLQLLLGSLFLFCGPEFSCAVGTDI